MKSNYESKTVKELKDIAKELSVEGYHKLKKEELIEAIQTKENVKEVEKTQDDKSEEISEINLLPSEEIKVESNKVSKQSIKKNITISVFNESGELIKSFDNKPNAIKYCNDNNIMNPGWFGECLKNGRKAYYNKQGKKTTSRNNRFTGIGYTVTCVETQ